MKTFQEQFDKLVKAYMNDKVRPMNPCACFVGNLLNGTTAWSDNRTCVIRSVDNAVVSRSKGNAVKKYKAEKSIHLNSEGTYTYDEIIYLEKTFMKIWATDMESEDTLFEAFEETLLALREIHESKGEVIKDYSFKKRELVNA